MNEAIAINFLCILLGSTVGIMLKSYFFEKGKNYATKKDVEEITRKIEGVKADDENLFRKSTIFINRTVLRGLKQSTPCSVH